MKVWTGIIPPKKIYNEILKIEKEIAKKYKTYYNLESKIGPHITITFQENVKNKDFEEIKKVVDKISKNTKPFSVEVDGVARFYKNKAIYLKVLKSKKLNDLYKELSSGFKVYGKIRTFRPFTPHITLAYKDLTKENFRDIFKELKNKNLFYEFNVDELHLGKAETIERIRVVKSFKLKF